MIQKTTATTVEQPRSFADILRREDRFAQRGSSKSDKIVNSWFDELMVQSGADVQPVVVLLLALLGAVLLGGGALVIGSRNSTALKTSSGRASSSDSTPIAR